MDAVTSNTKATESTAETATSTQQTRHKQNDATTESSAAANKIKFKFLDITNIHHLKKSEIYEYIVQLHCRLKYANKRLKKYKEKLRKNRRLFNVTSRSTPVDQENEDDVKEEKVQAGTQEHENNEKDVKPNVVEAKPEDTTTRPISPQAFIDEIKQAAENAQNQMGFVYEPTSGLYYDCKTGYYYNAVSLLLPLRTLQKF